MSTSHNREWVALYEDALAESEPKPFVVRALLAKRAMVERLQEFNGSGSSQQERNDLARAVTNLRALEAQIRHTARSESGIVGRRQAA